MGEDIGTVTADGAYDTSRCHTAIIDRQATAIIPIRKNGRPWKEDCPAAIARNGTLRATRHSGRAFWKRWTGYHVRSRIEAIHSPAWIIAAWPTVVTRSRWPRAFTRKNAKAAFLAVEPTFLSFWGLSLPKPD
jgi:hypothetical protein